jgi:pimeloyl-ACP methyl ester carboxylesterase
MHFAVRYPARVGALVVTGPSTGVAADRRQATLNRAATAEREGMRSLLQQEGTANSYPPELRHNPDEFRKLSARYLPLLCHKISGFELLAARTSGEVARQCASDDDADSGDGVEHMAFRADWGIRGVGNLGIGEVL